MQKREFDLNRFFNQKSDKRNIQDVQNNCPFLLAIILILRYSDKLQLKLEFVFQQ